MGRLRSGGACLPHVEPGGILCLEADFKILLYVKCLSPPNKTGISLRKTEKGRQEVYKSGSEIQFISQW